MASVETNWIDFFISLAPVVQTGIWAGVAIGAMITLKHPLKQLAGELVRRVNEGDNVKTPWLTLERKVGRERKVVEQVTQDIRNEIPSSESGDAEPFGNVLQLEKLLNEVNHRFLTLSFSSPAFKTLDNKSVKASIYMTEWQTVSEFLNDCFNVAVDTGVDLPIWTYGIHWRLKNQRTGEYIRKSTRGPEQDTRPFKDLGLEAGDILIAERV